MPFPSDVDGLQRWSLGLFLVYVALGYLVDLAWHGRFAGKFGSHVKRIFDGSTFAASLILLGGVAHPPLLDLIGDVRPFLVLAGAIGLAYALHALAPSHT
jgi:hypothetical protein